jgi:topoisomerase-4 subunit A
VLWFTANPNGEAEVLAIKLKSSAKVRKLKFDLDFAELAIKGRGAGGNRVTKFPIAKIELKEAGVSTLAARKIWFDDTVQRLNSEERGDFLGSFKAKDRILTVMQSGEYQLLGYDLFTKFEEDMIVLEKWNPKKPISAVYLDGDKKEYFVKRFLVEPTDKKVSFISEHEDSQLEVISTDWLPQIKTSFTKVKGKEKDAEIIGLEEFIAIKGMKAIGNRLTTHKVKNIDLLEPLPFEEPEIEEAEEELEVIDESVDDADLEEEGVSEDIEVKEGALEHDEESVIEEPITEKVVEVVPEIKKKFKKKVEPVEEDGKIEEVSNVKAEIVVDSKSDAQSENEQEEKPKSKFKKKLPIKDADDSNDEQMTLF